MTRKRAHLERRRSVSAGKKILLAHAFKIPRTFEEEKGVAPALESKGIGWISKRAQACSGFPLPGSRTRATAYRDRRSIVHGFRFYASKSLHGRSSCLFRGTSRSRRGNVRLWDEGTQDPGTKFTPVGSVVDRRTAAGCRLSTVFAVISPFFISNA